MMEEELSRLERKHDLGEYYGLCERGGLEIEPSIGYHKFLVNRDKLLAYKVLKGMLNDTLGLFGSLKYTRNISGVEDDQIKITNPQNGMIEIEYRNCYIDYCSGANMDRIDLQIVITPKDHIGYKLRAGKIDYWKSKRQERRVFRDVDLEYEFGPEELEDVIKSLDAVLKTVELEPTEELEYGRYWFDENNNLCEPEWMRNQRS